MKNNKGFTLIELLAVIVILAILMGIIALNFTSIFSETQDKVYKTYEDSMKTAAIQYVIDSGDTPTATKTVAVPLSYLVGDTKRYIPMTRQNECAKPAYLDYFHNPRSKDQCIEKSYVVISVADKDRNQTDADGHTDNNKKYEYAICLDCNNYKSEACLDAIPTMTVAGTCTKN